MGEILSESGETILSEDGSAILTEGDASAVAAPSLTLTSPANNGGSYDLVSVKAGDTECLWADVITFRGSAVNLTDAESVTLRIRPVENGVLGEAVDREGEIEDAEAG